MTIPNKDTYDSYGGDLKDRAPAKNFHRDGATDLPAEDFNKCRASAAGLVTTSFLCYLKIRPYEDNPIIEYESVWNKIKTEPIIVSLIDSDIYTVKFPTTVIDLRGKRQPLNIFSVLMNRDEDNSSGPVYASITKNSPILFTIRRTVGILTTPTFDLFFF